jgi:hypothetical protein
MRQMTDDTLDRQVLSENRICDCAPAASNSAGTAGFRRPAANPNKLLQFWRLSPRLELRRGHGRLMIDGKSYWK